MKMAILVLETIKDENGNFIPCIVEEGTKGFYETSWQWGQDYDVAKRCARDFNKRLDLTEKDVMKLIAQSMRR